MKSKWQIILDHIKFWGVILLALLIVGSVVWAYFAYEYGIWHECLRDQSWFYCHRIL